jgi:hypothetical protein
MESFKFNLDNKIQDIINSRCKIEPKTKRVSYNNKCSWVHSNPTEEYYKGFKRNHPEQYENAFNDIFDELHPY